MTDNTRFTIVIPAHNRPEHLRRLLDYYLDYDIQIIVSDSSNSEFKYIEEYQTRMIYKSFPLVPLAEKLLAIFPYIKTPYVLMCADDDFIVPESINEIIDFLEIHTDYNSGQGLYIDFTPTSNCITRNFRYPNLINKNLDSIIPSQRLLDLQADYFQYYYCVLRKEAFINSYKSVITNGKTLIYNLSLLESYNSSFLAIDGKHIVLPIFYAARENIVNSAGNTTEGMEKILTKKEYKKEYTAFIELLSSFLAEKESISMKDAREVVIKSVFVYMDVYFPKYLTNWNYILRIIKKILIIIDIFNLRFYFFESRYKRQNYIMPEYIEKSIYWDRIQNSIEKYYFIYQF